MSWSWSWSWSCGTFVSLMMGSVSMVFLRFSSHPFLLPLCLFPVCFSLCLSFAAWLATKFIETKLVYYIFSLSLGKMSRSGRSAAGGRAGAGGSRRAWRCREQINDNQINFKYIFLFHYTLELKPRFSFVPLLGILQRRRQGWLRWRWWWWCDSGIVCFSL